LFSVLLSLTSLHAQQGTGFDSSLGNWISTTTFTWSDNGNMLGTIRFFPDGRATASWSGMPHYWTLDNSGALIVSAGGTQYVTRLVWDAAMGTYTGTRDRTSQVQDGVRCLVRPASMPPSIATGGTGSLTDDLRAWLCRTEFAWADNGSTIGTMRFSPDGRAFPTWSGMPHTWIVDAAGNLVVSAGGTQYVTRLRYDFASGSLFGARDGSSQVQDGVKTTLRVQR
jgi:hypothetical protein